jgi:hypothetical protein
MMPSRILPLILLASAAIASAQSAVPTANPLTRHYREGETLTYRMTGVNEDWHYTAQADGIVKKAADGSFFEEFRWSNMTSNGQPVTLAPSTADFRQSLSLDPSRSPSSPDLTKVDPRLIGPITDLMTIYVDDWLDQKIGILHHPGDHFFVPNGRPSSWADGTRVITGQSSIDFDLTLQSVDAQKQTAVLLVRHVPPQKSTISLPAPWMQAPVADTPNNWIEVSKSQDGKYQAGVGKETFDVLITASTSDGRILSASLDNPVQQVSRTCNDAALTDCGPPQPHTIHRHIEIVLVQ